MKEVERFVTLCFSKNTCERVNAARQKLFTVGLKTMENIPPTLHSLYQHGRRACYVTTFQWMASLVKQPMYIDPNNVVGGSGMTG